MSKDWKEYEEEIHNWLSENYPKFLIKQNIHIIGKKTGIPRKIDIYVKGRIAGFELEIIIDAKKKNRKIDVKEVEEFIGMLDDVGANKGVTISSCGYTSIAWERAYRNSEDIELDILSTNDLKKYQGFGAIPYAGNHGLLVRAPFGWVVDATQTGGFLASFYRRGLDIQQAMSEKEFAYINFWEKKD